MKKKRVKINHLMFIFKNNLNSVDKKCVDIVGDWRFVNNMLKKIFKFKKQMNNFILLYK